MTFTMYIESEIERIGMKRGTSRRKKLVGMETLVCVCLVRKLAGCALTAASY